MGILDVLSDLWDGMGFSPTIQIRSELENHHF